MKFSIAYYVILLYATAMFKPLIPIAIDAWDHTFAEAEHINEVHLKYGNNHLQKEIANTNSSDNKDQNNSRSEDVIAVHLLSAECAYHFSLNKIPTKYPVLNLSWFLNISIAKQSPPPKNF